MLRPILLLAGLSFLMLAGGRVFPAERADSGEPDGARKTELVRLVRQDCGSCHGLTLKGGLGPPLLPETLRDKPRESLLYTILGGRPGTAMPPWKTFLTEAEAGWVLDALIEGFPEDRGPHAGLRREIGLK